MLTLSSKQCIDPANICFKPSGGLQTGKTRASNNHNDRQMNVIIIIIHIKVHCYKYLDLYTSLFYDFLDNVCCSIGNRQTRASNNHNALQMNVIVIFNISKCFLQTIEDSNL